ncbi:hypothetical protein [Parendozoicomonas sp. Alg238-R29]|uniref:hypothetical protein n=1 Tax=Parendozoicomonas sp. Alg238-R29 TaxID=2993446 RepID=UPI00248F3892|nr:hypothetical protein [Parendozoicomonas sp. Alg238-R29]
MTTGTSAVHSSTSVTDKSIHLLNKCLDHQRSRFDQARLLAHQAAMMLRNQTLQLEKLNDALEDYRNNPAGQKPISIVNQASFRKLLIDVKDLQSHQVKREEVTYQRCQEDALKEQRKIKTMEKVLEKLKARKRQQVIRKDQENLDDRVAAAHFRQSRPH